MPPRKNDDEDSNNNNNTRAENVSTAPKQKKIFSSTKYTSGRPTVPLTKNATSQTQESCEETCANLEPGKILIAVDPDDPCLVNDGKKVIEYRTPGLDPRFQQQNQTLRCYVMYTDFYRCENILGEGHEACGWFKQVFTSICPNYWIEQWEELRAAGRMPWHKYKKQGDFPGDSYGN